MIFNKYSRVIIQFLILLILVVLIYSQMVHHDFINFDDPDYVTENTIVQKGITIEGIKWAFSFKDNDLTYWHPMTYISHMLDCQFFSLNPAMHHMSSLFVHIINVFLLYFLLNKIFKNRRGSIIAAFLFALHPISVDSVAWVAQRKTLLVTFFWLMTIICYSNYIQKGGAKRYLMVCVFTASGLMVKPLMVTMPVTLLIFDFWPYSRIRHKKAGLAKIVIEKIPLAFLSLLWAGTIFIPKHVLAKNIGFEEISLFLRVKNALVAYIIYLKQFFLPLDFVILYPYPDSIALWKAAASLIILLIITFAAFKSIKKAPYIIIGWLIFTVTLVPFSGLIQGAVWPAHADRFAYVPFIGLYIIAGWGINDILIKFNIKSRVYIPIGHMVVICLSMITYNQISYWKNSVTVYQHTLSKTEKNYVVYNNLGTAYQEKGETEEALKYFFLALWAKPGYSKAFHNIAIAYINQEKYNDAIDYFLMSLKSNPYNYIANYNLGNLFEKQGRYEDAIAFYGKAISNEPGFADSYNNIGVIYQNLGEYKKAVKYYREALDQNSNHINTLCNMGNLMIDYGQMHEAIMMFRRALVFDPQNIMALNGIAICHIYNEKIYEADLCIKEILTFAPHSKVAETNLHIINKLKIKITTEYDNLIKQLNFIDTGLAEADKYPVLLKLGQSCEKTGKYEEAKEHYLNAVSLLPEKTDAFMGLAGLFEYLQEYNNAVIFYNKAAEANHSNKPAAYYNIACVFSLAGDEVESIKWLSKAVDTGYDNWEQLRSEYRLNTIRKTDTFIEFLNVAGLD